VARDLLAQPPVGVRAPLTALAGVLGVALVAWASGALAVHVAQAPTGCVPLRAGDRIVRVDGRDVLVHVPRGTTGPLPLVLALHGAGESGPDFAVDTGFSRLADREHFLVAYPSAGGRHPFWNVSGRHGMHNHVEELERSLDALESTACVDRARVFVTGVSNGGGFATRIACELSGRLAGIAAVAGGYRSLPSCRPERPLPVLEIHGTADHVVPYRGRPPDGAGSVDRWLADWRRIDACPGRALHRRIERGVTEVKWTGCAQQTVVEHLRLAGVRHGWPGGDRIAPPPAPFSATWWTWAFFRGLPGRRPV
jgi:polyhydroxybutyrate depolymerase